MAFVIQHGVMIYERFIEYFKLKSANYHNCEGVTRQDSRSGISLDQLRATRFLARNTIYTSPYLKPSLHHVFPLTYNDVISITTCLRL